MGVGQMEGGGGRGVMFEPRNISGAIGRAEALRS
jgi:hypothetical protein